MIDLKYGDCLAVLKDIPDKSINLIVTDPPYNIGKSKDWDKYKADEYINFMGTVFQECQRVLADNGQLYFFHNNIVTISHLMQYMEENTNFVFSSFVILPKPKFRRLSWSNPSDASCLRSWFNICEFALLYINGNSVHTEWDKTGWDRVRLDVNNFANLRKYAYDMLLFIGEGGGYSVLKKTNQQRFGTQKS